MDQAFSCGPREGENSSTLAHALVAMSPANTANVKAKIALKLIDSLLRVIRGRSQLSTFMKAYREYSF